MDFIVEFLLDFGYIALFICMALENMNIPIPSEIILGFAGFLISQGIFDFTTATVVATLAGLVGSLLSYYMGLKGGRELMLRHTEKGGLGAQKLTWAKNWFERYGGIAVFTGRLLPGIRTFISLPAGIAKFPMGKFIIYTLLGTIPWTIFLLYMGDLLGENWTLLVDYKLEIGITCLVLAAMMAAVFYIFHPTGKKKNK